MFTDPETGEIKNGIMEVRYSHDAMIDLMIACPYVSQNELAAKFHRSASWISQMIRSDAFQARLAERKEVLVDPELAASLKEMITSVAHVSLKKIISKLESPYGTPSDDFLLKTAALSMGALGYSPQPAGGKEGGVSVNVINMPQRASSAADWAAANRPLVERVIDERPLFPKQSGTPA